MLCNKDNVSQSNILDTNDKLNKKNLNNSQIIFSNKYLNHIRNSNYSKNNSNKKGYQNNINLKNEKNEFKDLNIISSNKKIMKKQKRKIIIIWITILFLWVADSIRIKYKTDDTFYNFLKIKRHKKNFYLFKEENAKESNSQLQKLENSNKNKIMKTIQNLKKELVFPLKFSANKELIEDQNSQSINVIIENNVKNLNISNNSNEHSHSKNSSVLSDSFQKPENMIIIGTDENGYPIYGHQNSFDKSQKGNDDSDSFSNNEKKFNQSNYIKFNDTTLNVDDTMNDIENNLEKNSILEKDIDEIKPKIIEKKNENDNENENENNDYKEHFMPLQSGENDKEIENQVNELQTNKIN